MSELHRQRLFAVFTDGAMIYPIFAEVKKGEGEVDVDFLRREVAAQYGIEPTTLKIISYPRWAIPRQTARGHVVHLGMIPAELPEEAR